MAAPPTLGEHTMWEAVPPGDSSAKHGVPRKSIALTRPHTLHYITGLTRHVSGEEQPDSHFGGESV